MVQCQPSDVVASLLGMRKAYIQSFVGQSLKPTDTAFPADSPRNTSAPGSSHDMSLVVNTGPCADFQLLRTFVEIKAGVSFDACQSDEDIKLVKNKFQEMRVPIVNLLRSCKTAMSDLHAAKTALDKSRLDDKKNKQDEMKRRGSVGPGGGARSGPR